MSAAKRFGQQLEREQDCRPAARMDCLRGGALHELDRTIDLAELLARAHHRDGIERLLRQVTGSGPRQRGAIVRASTQAVEDSVVDQAMQAVAAVLASDQERTPFRQRQQAGWPGSGPEDAFGRIGGDRLAHRQHFDPALLRRAETAENFALDVRAKQRAAANPELAWG